MNTIEDTLRKLEAEGNLRELRTAGGDGKWVVYEGVRYLDMSSNDYLGIGADVELQRQFFEEIADDKRFLMSNSASRLMSGNSADYDDLEGALSGIYGDKACLVLGSGYAVNSGLLPAIVSKDDVILADKLVHASIIDGLRLGDTPWNRFRHNDMDHLETLIKKHQQEAKGDIWVVTESIFSMDGDCAPIRELVELKQRYGIKLYIDEAHAFGVCGANGGGLSEEVGVGEQVDIIVGTLGKATASCGGFAILQPLMRELLINKMRTLIYSTAIPPINLRWSKFVVDRLASFEPQREHLKSLATRFDTPNARHIIPIMAHDNQRAIALAEAFRKGGYWVTPIRFPSVPKGAERIRVSLSAAMNDHELDNFIEICRAIG